MTRVNEEKYSDRLAEGLVSAQESVLPALEASYEALFHKLRFFYIFLFVHFLINFSISSKGNLSFTDFKASKNSIPFFALIISLSTKTFY